MQETLNNHPENRHRLTVFTVSEIQLNIFDGSCHECCAVHTIPYCMQTFEGVGKKYFIIQFNILLNLAHGLL